MELYLATTSTNGRRAKLRNVTDERPSKAEILEGGQAPCSKFHLSCSQKGALIERQRYIVLNSTSCKDLVSLKVAWATDECRK